MSEAKILQTSSRSNSLRLDRVIVRAAPTGRFRKEFLPLAFDFYRNELGPLGRSNRKGWCACNCPFHKSQSGRSFSVNIQSGGFHCFGCDAHGGDLVSFLRLRDGLTFKEAAQQLGCWDEDGPPIKVPTRLVPYLVLDFDIDGTAYRAEVNDEPKTELQLDRRFYA